ncbi:unnamed protein product, partial [Lampetra fluviatilis]
GRALRRGTRRPRASVHAHCTTTTTITTTTSSSRNHQHHLLCGTRQSVPDGRRS